MVSQRSEFLIYETFSFIPKRPDKYTWAKRAAHLIDQSYCNVRNFHYIFLEFMFFRASIVVFVNKH